MSVEDMHRQANARWNDLGRVPIHAWLMPSATELDKRRLKACGNVVMPRVGQLALHVHMHQVARER